MLSITVFGKMSIFILKLLILFISNVKAIINPFGPTVVGDFTNCISELIETNCKNSGLLIFANTKNVSSSASRIRAELLAKIHLSAKYSIQITSPANEQPVCVDNEKDDELNVIHKDQFQAVPLADYGIIVIDSYKDFTRVASRLIRSRTWNPHAKFIILYFHTVKSVTKTEEIVEKILTCLFKHNAINVVVAVPESIKIRNAIIYGWRPYNPPKYCGYYNETAKGRLLKLNTCDRGVLKLNIDIFKNSIPLNLKGCVLQVLAIERLPFVSADPDETNIESWLVTELAELYNIETRIEILQSYRGERDDEGNWDGALKKLAAKEGHLVLGGVFPDFDVHEDFECSPSYFADSYTWIAPRAFPQPPWVALLIIFQELVWYSVIAGFGICVLFWRVLGQISADTLYHRTFNHCFMNVWISTFGFCAYARPAKKSLRLFYIFFNLYCVLLITGYQTKLMDVLRNPSTEEQIDTIEELVESGLKFGGPEELHDIFINSTDEFDYLIGQKWTDVDNLTKALLDVSLYRNFSVLCSRLELAHMSAIIPELSDSSGHNKYFAFEQSVFTVPMEMVALRGFALIQKISHTLGLFKQLGVNAGIRKRFASMNALRKAKLIRDLQMASDVKPLTIQLLQGGFLALLLGTIGGTIALFIEIFLNTEYVKIKIFQIKQYLSKSQRISIINRRIKK